MKIAVTAMGGSLEAQASERFGRCPYFIIYDTETQKFNAVSNLGEQMQNSAGPKAAEIIIKEGAEVLLTGNVGNNADVVLNKANIRIVTGISEKKKVKEVIDEFLKTR